MKKFIFALMLIMSTLTLAQFTSDAVISRNNSGVTVTFAGTLDTLTQTYDSLMSGSFTLEDFDESNYLTVYYDFESTAGSPKALVDLYYSEDNSTFTNVTQLVDTTTSETPTWTATNLSYVRPAYYKLVVEQVAAGRDGTTFTIKLRYPAKEASVRRE